MRYTFLPEVRGNKGLDSSAILDPHTLSDENSGTKGVDNLLWY